MTTTTATSSSASTLRCPSIQKLVDETAIEVVSYTPELLTVHLRGVRPHVPATLRNTIMTHNWTMRFEHACVTENSLGQDADENLALELGKIPLHVDADDFVLEKDLERNDTTHNYDVEHRQAWQMPYERDFFLTNKRGYGLVSRPGMPECGTIHEQLPVSLDPRAHLVFSLDVECDVRPSDGRLVHRTVWSRDLHWVPLPGQLERYGPGKAWFHPGIRLLRLARGQRVRGIFVAAKGQGYEHIKWCPAKVDFRILPRIHVRNAEVRALEKAPGATVRDIEDLGTHRDRLVYSCPQKLIQKRDDGTGDLYITDASKCDLCRECQEVPLLGGLRKPVVAIDAREDQYILTIETQGDQDSLAVLRRALVALKDKFDQLEGGLRQWDEENLIADNL